MSSCPSNKSQDTSPAASPHISTRKVVHVSSGDELETDHDNGIISKITYSAPISFCFKEISVIS